MRYHEKILDKIFTSEDILSQMITNAKNQGAKNFDMFYSLANALSELKEIVKTDKKIDSFFLKKWDAIIGWAPKVFEGHPLLDIIRDIDEIILLK